MLLFQALCGLDGLLHVPSSEPDLSVEAHAAGHDVDVVVLGVAVAHGHVGGQVRKVHPLHELVGDAHPLFAGEALIVWER